MCCECIYEVLVLSEMVRIHLNLERGLEGCGMEVSRGMTESEIEGKDVIGKGDCQGGGKEMEHLLVMWGNRGSKAWTHGE